MKSRSKYHGTFYLDPARIGCPKIERPTAGKLPVLRCIGAGSVVRLWISRLQYVFLFAKSRFRRLREGWPYKRSLLKKPFNKSPALVNMLRG